MTSRSEVSRNDVDYCNVLLIRLPQSVNRLSHRISAASICCSQVLQWSVISDHTIYYSPGHIFTV